MRARTRIRKLINTLGIDIHRHIKRPDKLDVLKQFDIKTVLDIGANIGQSAFEFRALLPHAYIYSFEPLPDCFKKLTKAMSTDVHFKAFSFALGAEDAQASINKSSYDQASSLMEMADAHKQAMPHTAGVAGSVIVEVKRLDDVAKNLTLVPDMLIKMDVQGFENQVIQGGQETIRKAKVVLIENSFVELYVGQALFDDIYEKMKSLGFTYQGALSQKYDPTNGNILFEDSLFVRP